MDTASSNANTSDYESSTATALSSTPSEPDSSALKAKRRRQTGNLGDCCRTCRLRKVKCTGMTAEGSGRCANCDRLDLACSVMIADGEAPLGSVDKISRITPSRKVTEAGTVRKRAQRACEQCHIHKTKCSGDLPLCKRCEDNSLVCEYKPTKRKFSHATTSNRVKHDSQDSPEDTIELKDDNLSDEALLPTPGSPARVSQADASQPQADYFRAEDLLFQRDVLLRHFDIYFQLHFHIGFLHPATTYLAIEKRTLAPNIAAAVCAVTSRIISPGQEKQPFAAKCIDQIDFHIFKNMDSFFRQDAYNNLVILALAIWYYWPEGRWNKVWMYMAMSARGITTLQLNWNNTSGTFIEQESSRRLVWFIYILDRILSCGYEEHLVLRDEVMHLRLPFSNEAYREGKQPFKGERQAGVKEEPEFSMYSCAVRLHRMRHQILSVTRRFVNPPASQQRRPRLEPSQVIKLINGLQMQLNKFSEAIPEEFKFSEVNMHRNFHSSERSGFIMLHTLYWQLHIDLYRFSVPGLREQADHDLSRQLPTDFIFKSQKQAVGYAVSLARFWLYIQRLVAHKPPGVERLVTIDHTLVCSVVECTKLLVAARQHRLYNDLLEHSSAPLIVCSAVTNEVLKSLAASNIDMLHPFTSFLPMVQTLADDLQASCFDDFISSEAYDRAGLVKTLKVEPLYEIPKPHSVLENVLAKQTEEEDDESDRSLAEKWFRQTPSAREDSGIAREIAHRSDAFPQVPLGLAEARGFKNLPRLMECSDTNTSLTPSQQLPLPLPPHSSGSSFSFASSNLWPMHQGYDTMDADLKIMYFEPALRYTRARGTEAIATLSPYITHPRAADVGAYNPHSQPSYR